MVRTCFYFWPAILASIKKHDPQLNTVSAQVRKFRLRKGWSQLQLAQAMQLEGWDASRDSITRLENDSRRIGCYEMFTVAKCLGIEPNDLCPPDFRFWNKSLAPAFRRRLTRGRVPPTAA